MAGIREQRQQRTREALLDAAARVFASHGYGGASIPEIAREAGLSTGAIYSNFSGKEELFLAMMGRSVQAGAEARAKSVANVTDDRDRLIEELVATWTDTVDDGPQTVILMAEFWLYALRHPPYDEVMAGFLAAVRSNLATTMTEAAAEIDDDLAAQLATAVQALSYGHAMQRLVDPDAAPHRQLVESIAWLVRGATSTPDR